MRAKCDAFFGHLAKITQAKNLEAAGIGQDRMRPGHELMQPAQSPYGVNAWTEIEVISVAKQNLDANVLQHVLGYALDRRERSHRHEDRGFNLAVRGEQPT